jgi:hypothetical protein
MKRYSVLVTRDCTESTEVEVMAKNKAEARDRALEIASRGPTSYIWTQNDNNSEPYLGDEINDVREIKRGVKI